MTRQRIARRGSVRGVQAERGPADRPPETGLPERPTPETVGRLGSGTIARLQRAAGNAGVAGLFDGAGLADGAAGVEAAVGSGGEPLPAELREEMERSFATDLSSVRVHRGAEAEASAAALGARAYTLGEDVVVGEGGDDRRTLAHELAHVVQQRRGQVDGTPGPGGVRVSEPGDRFERAAEATADRVVAGAARGGAAAWRGPAVADGSTAAVGAMTAAVQRAPFPDDEEPDVPGGATGQEAAPGAQGAAEAAEIPTIDVEDLPKAAPEGGAQPAAGGPAPAAASGSAGGSVTGQIVRLLYEHSLLEPTRDAAAAMAKNPPDYDAAMRGIAKAADATDQLIGVWPEKDPGLAKVLQVDEYLRLSGAVIAPRSNMRLSTSDAEIAEKLTDSVERVQKILDDLAGGALERGAQG